MFETETIEPLLVDSATAARILKVSPKTLFTMRTNGEIPFIRMRSGRQSIRFSVEELKKWIGERQERAGEVGLQ